MMLLSCEFKFKLALDTTDKRLYFVTEVTDNNTKNNCFLLFLNLQFFNL